MRISDYPLMTNFKGTERVVMDTDEGTKAAEVIDLPIKLDAIYPIGAIYLSFNSTSPAKMFGGSWTQISGRFLRAAADTATGGNDRVDHSHVQTVGADSNTYYIANASAFNKLDPTTGKPTSSVWTSGTEYFGGGSYSFAINTDEGCAKFNGVAAGFNKATSGSTRVDRTATQRLSNMPAYQDIYAWRRTA